MFIVHFWWWLERFFGASNTSGVAYGFWSGSVSDISEITLIGMAVAWYKSGECHIDERRIGGKNCHKRGRYPFRHYKLCKYHHPNVPEKVTHLHIIKLHKEASE